MYPLNDIYIASTNMSFNVRVRQAHSSAIPEGINHRQILLDGVSSSGKTTISKFFVAQGYIHINSDDTNIRDLHYCVQKIVDTNKYYSAQEMKSIGEREKTRLMYEKGIGKNVVYDDISQNILQHFLNKDDIFVINVYASLETLVRNILSRRFYEPRGQNVFRQFSEKYTLTDNDKGIEIINRKKFRILLKENLKYIFESEEDLNIFVDKMFTSMNITDDKDHKIKLRAEFKCDYLLNTTDKTPEQIFDELRQFISAV